MWRVWLPMGRSVWKSTHDRPCFHSNNPKNSQDAVSYCTYCIQNLSLGRCRHVSWGNSKYCSWKKTIFESLGLTKLLLVLRAFLKRHSNLLKFTPGAGARVRSQSRQKRTGCATLMRGYTYDYVKCVSGSPGYGQPEQIFRKIWILYGDANLEGVLLT